MPKQFKAFLFLILIIILTLSTPKITFAAINITSLSTDTINSVDDVLIITASASALQNNTQYLEVAYTKDGETSNFFGLTLSNKDEWYQYKSSPAVSDLSSYFYSFIPTNGSWSGQLQTKIDINDPGFKGPGKYNIKLLKYITSSSTPSNTMSINVNVALPATPIPTLTPTKIPTPTKTPTSQPTPSKIPPTPTKSISPTIPKPTLSKSKSASISAGPTSVLGISIKPAAKKEPPKQTLVNSANQNKFPIFVIIGSIFLLACAILTYFRLTKNQE